MTEPTIAQVDAAVRAVLGDLSRGAERDRSAGSIFADRLLSLRQVEILPRGTAVVQVAPGTVITPLARDHLKRLGIGVRVISESEARRHREGGTWGFAIDHDSGLASALRRALMAGAESWDEIGRSVLDAARWVAEGEDRGAAFFTEEASVAAWLANRVPGVRAATVGEAEAVGRASRRLGANLLVIEPSCKSIHAVKHMLTTFRRAGAPAPPDDLTRGLDFRAEDHADCRGDRSRHIIEEPSQPAERALRDRLAHAARGAAGGHPRSW